MNKLYSQLRSAYEQQAAEKQLIVAAANNVLHDAKRAIFAIQRQELTTAATSLQDLEQRLRALQSEHGQARLNQEGCYQAAVEEYVEAKFFYQLTSSLPLKKITGLQLGVNSYLGGLCDVCGELVRQAINAAARRDYQTVRRNHQLINDIVSELTHFDCSGYLRTKYDQARQQLRKIEDVNYQISLQTNLPQPVE